MTPALALTFYYVVFAYALHLRRILQDLLFFSPREIYDAACQKLHPLLEPAFVEAGTPTLDGHTKGAVSFLERL
jgi:hypothetical protein